MIYNKDNFRIVFMGTPDFAVASLDALMQNGFNIVGVVTSPDKPAGRGKKISESAVKQYAVHKSLKILQPTNLKSPDFQQELKELNAHLQIVVAFRMLPESIWNMPPLGSINLHASLLPMYRGAAPINWAVINGETETGVTTFFLKHKIDTGNILFQEKIKINANDNVGVVHDRLMQVGANLLVKTTEKVMEDDYTEKPQDEFDCNSLKNAPKIFKPDCKIDWNKPLIQIQNLIRGLSPYPCAWSNLTDEQGKILSCKIFDTEVINEQHNLKIGTIVTDNKSFIKVAVNSGFIAINELQLAGKKRMQTKAFLQGFKQISNYKFE